MKNDKIKIDRFTTLFNNEIKELKKSLLIANQNNEYKKAINIQLAINNKRMNFIDKNMIMLKNMK